MAEPSYDDAKKQLEASVDAHDSEEAVCALFHRLVDLFPDKKDELRQILCKHNDRYVEAVFNNAH